MPPDSLRQAIIDSLMATLKSDTTTFKIVTAQNTQSNPVGIWIPVIAAVVAAVITNWITAYFKSKELKKAQAELDLKQKTFEQTIKEYELKSKEYELKWSTTWQQIANEGKRIEDLKKNFELNLDKFNYAKYERLITLSDKVLEGSDKERIQIIKELSSVLEDINAQIPPPDVVWDEHERLHYAVSTIARSFNQINKITDRVFKEHPHVSQKLNTKLRSIQSWITSLEHRKHHNYNSDYEGYQEYLGCEEQDIIQVYKLLDECVKEALADFEILEKVRIQLMKDNFRHTINEDETTTA